MVTPAEAEVIDRMAAVAGLSVSEFLRRQIVPGEPESASDAEALQVFEEILDGMHRDVARAIGAIEGSLGRMSRG